MEGVTRWWCANVKCQPTELIIPQSYVMGRNSSHERESAEKTWLPAA